jgi:hypothetical protein
MRIKLHGFKQLKWKQHGRPKLQNQPHDTSFWTSCFQLIAMPPRCANPGTPSCLQSSVSESTAPILTSRRVPTKYIALWSHKKQNLVAQLKWVMVMLRNSSSAVGGKEHWFEIQHMANLGRGYHSIYHCPWERTRKKFPQEMTVIHRRHNKFYRVGAGNIRLSSGVISSSGQALTEWVHISL